MPVGKFSAPSSLGRAIIKSRENKPTARKSKKAKDGEGNNYISENHPKGNVAKSIVEENDLDEFLAKADLAGTTFEAEYMTVNLVSADDNKLVRKTMDKENIQCREDAKERLKDKLRIPRRPKWTAEMNANEVKSNENMKFLEWRRELASLEEDESVILTPFERNLEVWRQLWRVIERSDIIVQIVDARNPLLFRCPDLETYVREVGEGKVNFILVNKADLLTAAQRRMWAKYFRDQGIAAAFWSAASLDKETIPEPSEDLEKISDLESGANLHLEKNLGLRKKEDSMLVEKDLGLEQKTKEELEQKTNEELEQKTNEKLEQKTGHMSQQEESGGVKIDQVTDEDPSKADQSDVQGSNGDSQDEDEFSPGRSSAAESNSLGHAAAPSLRSHSLDHTSATPSPNSASDEGRILTSPELLNLLKSLLPDKGSSEMLTVGMVGYPNVGKSSTVNKLIGQKKVAVSATPGKTKHFQTLFIEKHLCLCDCPGLVMPSFVLSKEQMLISGILPPDEMRECTQAIQLICSQIDRRILERVYGIILPKPSEYDDPNRSPTPNELLTTYAFLRGFMTSKGIPDSSRAARIIVKDYVNGRLRYCYAPPGVDQASFEDYEEPTGAVMGDNSKNDMLAALHRRHLLQEKPKTADFDRSFFTDSPGAVHVKSGKKSITGLGLGKKHHNNKNKKEKLRRVYGHLDA